MTEPAPSEPTEPAKRPNGCGMLLAVVAIIGVAAWACTAAFGDDTPDETDNEYTAIAACENSVEAQLRAPATADFGGEVATRGTGGTYTVTGHVDAENGFGAQIRTRWTCEARPSGGDGDYRGLATLLEG